MAEGRWDRIESLFAMALDLPPDRRPSFLRVHCKDNECRAEVAALLSAYQEAGDFFENLRDDLSAPELDRMTSAEEENTNADLLGLVGTEVAGYVVQEHVAGGGMGIVYRAWDAQLERSVALKFLPPVLAAVPEAKARFVQEARTAARLEHPNVATIHEIGDTEQGRRFIAMAHYDGETLRERLARTGPFRVADAIECVRTIAEALHQVHLAGIVHRDVKPSNVMMTAQGTIKLIDFGLAEAAAESEGAALTLRTGTPAYMSPEQADGSETGPQTDLWALGILLFELLTGDRPFSVDQPNTLPDAIQDVDPESVQTQRPGVPHSLASIVSRCLRTDPTERYASAEMLAEALRSLERQRKPEVSHAIAVLPFTPRKKQNGGPFTAGMHESILGQLSSVSDLKVVAGTAPDRSKSRSLATIADELDVRWVVTGSVWRTDDRIQISVQLTDGRNDTNVWAETYRRDLTAGNLFDVQEQITSRVTEALTAEVTPGEEERITNTPTRNLNAYRLYVKGRANLNRYEQGSFVAAVDQFQKAVEEDATFALAWAGLADAVNLFPLFGPDDHDEPEIEGEHAARRALELDPDLAEAHAALGYLQDLPEGIPRLRDAVDLKPSYAQAHQWLGLKLLVAGNLDTAWEHASIAADLAPSNRATQGFLAYMHIVEGRYREGFAILKEQTRTFEVEPDWAVDISSRFLFAGLHSIGQWEKAQSLVHQRRDAVDRPAWRAQWIAKQGMLETALGREALARQRVEQLQEVPGALYRGLLLMALGEEDAAVESFREVQTWGYYNVVEFRYFYPEILDSFRQTDLYETLLGIIEQRRAPNPTAAYRATSSTPRNPSP